MQNMINSATNPLSNTNNNVERISGGILYNSAFPKFSIEDVRSGIFQKTINENCELLLNFSHYYNIVSSFFKFENVPSIYRSNFILQILIQYSEIAICKDENGEFFIAPYNAENAKYNEVGEPIEIKLQDYSLFNCGRNSGIIKVPNDKIFKNAKENKEFSIIKSTPSNLPLIFVIYYFTLKIIETQTAIDNNIFVMQQPVIFSGTDEQKLTMQALFQKLTNKVRAFFILKRSGQMDAKMEVLDLKEKNYLESLQNQKEYFKKEFFEFFGINSVPFEKKERLLVDEVNSNNMLLELVQSVYYQTIKDSIDECNKNLGTDIKFSFNINGFINKGGENNADDYQTI